MTFTIEKHAGILLTLIGWFICISASPDNRITIDNVAPRYDNNGNIIDAHDGRIMMYRYSIKNEKQVYRYYLVRSGTTLQWGFTIFGQLPRYIFRSAFRK